MQRNCNKDALGIEINGDDHWDANNVVYTNQNQSQNNQTQNNNSHAQNTNANGNVDISDLHGFTWIDMYL